MIPIASIVEGDGEVAALPIILRRLSVEFVPAADVSVLPPIRVRRDKFLNKDDEFRRQLLLAAAKSGDLGWILVVLDADDDCPKDLGAAILKRASAHVPHRRLSVVLANREFEAWFIAAAQSLNGIRGFSILPGMQPDAERPRDAKVGCANISAAGPTVRCWTSPLSQHVLICNLPRPTAAHSASYAKSGASTFPSGLHEAAARPMVHLRQ